MTKHTTTRGVTTSAIVLGACGLGMIFEPQELVSALGAGTGGTGSELAISLWGSPLFSLGVLIWIARRSTLGGIYGPPVVAANQAHAFAGTLIVLRLAFGSGLSWPLAALLAVYLPHAAFFSYLMLWASGIE
jgi:hypothetical protein